MGKTYVPRVERVDTGLTKLWIPHNGKEVALVIVDGNHKNSAARIKSLNLRNALPQEVASLMHATYCDANTEGIPEFQAIRSRMRKSWVHVHAINTFTGKGMYSRFDPTGAGRTRDPMPINELEKRIKGAKSIGRGIKIGEEISFAPQDTYKDGLQTSDEIARNGAVIACYGEKGAEQLARVGEKFLNKSCIWVRNVKERGKAVEQVSELYEDHDALVISFSSNGNLDVAYACGFGVVQ